MPVASTLTGSVTRDGGAGAGARGELLLFLGAGALVASASVGYAVRARWARATVYAGW